MRWRRVIAYRRIWLLFDEVMDRGRSTGDVGGRVGRSPGHDEPWSSSSSSSFSTSIRRHVVWNITRRYVSTDSHCSLTTAACTVDGSLCWDENSYIGVLRDSSVCLYHARWNLKEILILIWFWPGLKQNKPSLLKQMPLTSVFQKRYAYYRGPIFKGSNASFVVVIIADIALPQKGSHGLSLGSTDRKGT